MYEYYDQAVKGVFHYLTENRFSKTPKKDFGWATRNFRHFLSESKHDYSQEIAAQWLFTLEQQVSRKRFLFCRRALALVDQVLTYGYVKDTHFSYGITRTRYPIPMHFKDSFEAYLQRRKEDGCARSTIQMDRIACSRFLLFLENNGLTTFAQLTPELVKAYSLQEVHRTIEGKNAYIRRVKGFIRFLASTGKVQETLESALPVEKASRVAIVKTLSDEQISTIDKYRADACSPSELRNSAMAMLALCLGLRSVDICNLRLANIRWSSAALAITQQKTGRPLTLPFQAVVGNALSKYLLEGRPKCNSPYVFITLKRPYQHLRSTKSCYRTSVLILGANKSETDCRGLHIARKTYASELLKANIPVQLIAQALGHANETNVDKYLATDIQRMRKCATSLSGIQLPEVLQ